MLFKILGAQKGENTEDFEDWKPWMVLINSSPSENDESESACLNVKLRPRAKNNFSR